MENNAYSRLIYYNKIEDLAEIWNLSDLVEYQYLHKYLLEYLLEKGIHTTRMDSQAISNKLWVKLYAKYNITKPLTKTNLGVLLEKDDDGKLIFDIVLDKMNEEEKLDLYYNIKYRWFYIYRRHEELILSIFKKHDIAFSPSFLDLPKLKNQNIQVDKQLEKALNRLRKTYSDAETDIVDTIVEELKRCSKKDLVRTYNDINKLIRLKKENPNFKLCFNEEYGFNGSYAADEEEFMIDKYVHGVFKHELSHLLFDQYEKENSLELYKRYCKIRKNVMKPSTIKKIQEYLINFHRRYFETKVYFTEMYYVEVERQYKNFDKYYEKIKYELLETNPDLVLLNGDENEEVPTGFDGIENDVVSIINSESLDYANICTDNYYTEELYLENLLDALLLGRIHDGDIKITSYFSNGATIEGCFSGHSKDYFKEEKYLSLDEALADYEAIKSSKKGEIIIDKLIELVGEDIVLLFEDYLHIERNSKTKRLKYVKR